MLESSHQAVEARGSRESRESQLIKCFKHYGDGLGSNLQESLGGVKGTWLSITNRTK